MARQKMLIVIGGPTASGKTSLAIKLANHFKTEIISADSRQFYKEMSIGTAKPTKDELLQAPHHFIGHISIHDEYSAGQFELEAMSMINNLFQTKDYVILAGGSGLFLKAVTEGLDDFPEIDPGIRRALNEEYEEKGLSHLQSELQSADPAYFEKIDKENPRRLIRALEVTRATGNPMSFYQKGKEKDRPFDIVYLQPHWNREKLYERIEQRVELMFEAGLEEEVKTLQSFSKLQSLQTVGYQEVFEYLAGNSDLQKAKTMIKKNSRRYAKRQLTWARQRGQWVLLKPNFASYAIQYLELIEDGWVWNIERIKDQKRKTHQEEKISRITLSNDNQNAKVLVARQPKMMQTYWEFPMSLDEKISQFLIEQVEMQADTLPIMVWCHSDYNYLFEENYLLISKSGYFPFDGMVPEQKELCLFKRSN